MEESAHTQQSNSSENWNGRQNVYLTRAELETKIKFQTKQIKKLRRKVKYRDNQILVLKEKLKNFLNPLTEFIGETTDVANDIGDTIGSGNDSSATTAIDGILRKSFEVGTYCYDVFP